MIEALRVGLADRASSGRLARTLREHGFSGDDDRLRAVAEEISGFVVATPDRISALMHLTRDGHHGRAVAFGLAQILVYVVDEHDLVSDAPEGGAGLLDDAYLVFRFLEDVCRAYPAGRKHAETLLGQDTAALIARLLADGVGPALDRMSERLLLVGASLFQTGGGTVPSSDEVPAASLRMDCLS